ncbi:MAG: PAS domain S-box protein [Desulfobacteraceae bacterium]|nr:PAS domain S-box protein [Desulfobacteraceae bacterium]
MEAFRYIPLCKTFDDAAKHIFDHCKRLTGAHSGYVALLSENGEENEVLYLDADGFPCDVDPNLPMPIRGLREAAYKTKKVVYDNAFPESPWLEYMPDGHVKLENVLFTPLNIEDKTVGVIGIANKPGGFDNKDVQTTKLLGDLAAVALTYAISQDSLRKSEKKYQVLFEHTGEALFVAQDGKIVFQNPRSTELSGYSTEEFQSKPFFDFIHEDDREMVMDYHIQRLRGEKLPEHYAFRIIHKNGSILWAELNAVLIQWKGKPAILCLMNDITERKQAQEALIENEALFRGMFNDHSAVMLLIDSDTGQIIKANQAAVQYYGYPLEKMLQMKIQQLNLSSPEQTTQQMLSALNNQINIFEFRHLLADGQVRDVEVHSAPITIQHQTLLFSIISDITERKQAEATLRKSEERIRTIGDNLQGAQLYQLCVEPDGGTMFTYVSSKVEELHECKPEEVLKDASLLFKRVHPEDVDGWLKLTKKSLRELTTYDHTVRIVKKSGEIRWHRMISKPQKLQDGSVLFDGVELDITEHKRAEDALRESNKTAHQFFSESSAGAFFMMLDEPVEWNDSVDKEKVLDYVFDHQRITKINRAMLDQYLASEKDFLCMTPKQLFAHDLEHGRLLWRKMFDQGFLDIESDERRFDGSQMWIIGSYRCMSDEQGRITGHFGTQLDITEHKRMMEDLRKDRERMAHILRATRTNMNTLDSEYNLRQVDAVWQKIYGDPQGRKCYEYFMGHDKPCNGCGVPKALATREIVVTEEFLHKENRHIEVHTIPFQDENGEWLVTEFNINITERKQAETEKEKLQAQLTQAQKMESVGRLAGGVAHDFNNMLGVILGHTEFALEKAEEHHDLYADLKEIQSAAKRSADITKQLLAFARKQTISPRQIDLNDTVESMLNMLRRLIGEDIDLVWQPAAHIWPVKMDPSQIDQILANLCVNARDAISGVGKLTIETGKKTFDEEYCNEHPGFIPGDFVLLVVSDNGSGMDKETLDNLFEPFFTTKEVGKGTGLGLATVYGIVKQNNGFINIYSEPGQGSTFKIYLPRLVDDEEKDKAVPEKKATAGGTETLLLVEDEPTILRMTRMMLERKGYSVLPAATPVEAVNLAKTHADKIHLLMTDVVMPEMNGRELAGKITDLYPDIELLFMSGYTSNVIAHHGVLDKGVAFIQKPFSMADITAKVRDVLDMASDKNQG